MLRFVSRRVVSSVSLTLRPSPCFSSSQAKASRSLHTTSRRYSIVESIFGTASSKMTTPGLTEADTPDIIKNNKGLHLLTMSTPNGQKVQILLEELKELYGTKWSYTLLSIMTNVQKEDWFLRLDP